MAVELHEIFGSRAAALADALDQFPDGVAVFDPIRDDAGEIIGLPLPVRQPGHVERSAACRSKGSSATACWPSRRASETAGPFDGYRRAVEERRALGPRGGLRRPRRRRLRPRRGMEMRAVRLRRRGLLVTYRDVTSLRRGRGRAGAHGGDRAPPLRRHRQRRPRRPDHPLEPRGRNGCSATRPDGRRPVRQPGLVRPEDLPPPQRRRFRRRRWPAEPRRAHPPRSGCAKGQYDCRRASSSAAPLRDRGGRGSSACRP